MTLDRALELAGDLDRMDVETMEEIANAMPRYLWVIDHYMDDTGLPEYDLHATDDARLIHCEACGHETVELARGRRYATPLPHNTEMACPLCGQRVTVKHVSKGIKGMHDRLNVIFARKSEADPDVVLLIAAMVRRWFRDADVSEPWNLEPALSVTGFAVFDAANRDDLKVKRAPVDYDSERGQWGWYYKAVKRVKALTLGNWYNGFSQYAPPTRVFYDSISSAVEGTTLGRAYRDSYAEGDCAALLDLLTRYPATEYVSRLGLGALITRHIEGTLPDRMINWRGKSMTSVLRLSKDRIAQAKGKHIHLTPELIAVLQTVDGMGIPCGIETAEGVARACQGLYKRLPHDLREAVQRFQGSRRKKALKYIARHAKDRLSAVTDYWTMCERAGNDLRDDGEAFPRDFRAAHDRVVSRIKLLADVYKDRQIAQRLDDLDARFGFAFGGLILRPAVSCEEVVREGEVLHHCVGTYVERYAAGGTAIFVLRRAAQPDAPWRTVEIDPVHGILLQDRGLHNDWGQYQIDDTYRAALEMFWQAWRERPRKKARKSA